VCPINLTNEFTLCRGLKKSCTSFTLRNYLVGRVVCLNESSDNSASILQSKTNSALFKFQHYILCYENEVIASKVVIRMWWTESEYLSDKNRYLQYILLKASVTRLKSGVMGIVRENVLVVNVTLWTTNINTNTR